MAPVEVTNLGGQGRPRKVVDKGWLTEAMSTRRKITFAKLASALNIHRNTLRHYLKSYDLYDRYSSISDDNLDILVKVFKSEKPDSGLRYLVGFLRTHGVRVQRCRVTSSLQRVDPVGQVLRQQKITERRKYSVPRSNHLWHLDGHHKLIQWGIVIHGFVDGYSRMVCQNI